jgi:hypothetical protein
MNMSGLGRRMTRRVNADGFFFVMNNDFGFMRLVRFLRLVRPRGIMYTGMFCFMVMPVGIRCPGCGDKRKRNQSDQESNKQIFCAMTHIIGIISLYYYFGA